MQAVSEEKGYTQVNKEKTTMDFPFDLNNLFNMQYSFDQLKIAIEYLARQQGNHQTLINELLAREPGTTHHIEKIIERSTSSAQGRGGSRDGNQSQGSKSKFVPNETKPSTTNVAQTQDNPAATAPPTEIIREVSTPGGTGLGDDDLNNAISPLQKQATQNMRLLGALQDKVDDILGKIGDHDGRITKLENKTKNHDALHKNGKSS